MATKKTKKGLEVAGPEEFDLIVAPAAPDFEPIPEDELADWLLFYEEEQLDPVEVVRLFQTLIDTGEAWKLQGHYGRMAEHFISLGICKEA